MGEADLRTLIPFVGIFGGAGLGKIQQGKLYVDEGIPVCRETVPRLARIWPDVADAETAGMSIRELVEIHGYSRQDDAKNANWRRYLTDGDRRAVEAHIAQTTEDETAQAAGTPQQMRYEQAELVAGTSIFHRWGFRWPATRDELAGLAAGLLAWGERPHVGGRNSVGHGNLLVDYRGANVETRLLGDGSRPLSEWTGQTPTDALRDHIQGHMGAIRDVLARL